MKTCARLHEYEGRRCKKCQFSLGSYSISIFSFPNSLNPNTNVSKREWQKRNPDKTWISKNPDKHKNIIKLWRKSNPDRVKAITKSSRKLHPDSANASNNLRRTRKINATPKFLH
jgi:hypothetical protein